MKKSKTTLISVLIFLVFSILYLSCQYTEELDFFQFPKIDSVDPAIYNEIKETCRTRWDLKKMIDDTFEIRKDGTEYSINCDGFSGGRLYHFVIRVDNNGKWINGGRSLKNP